MLDKIQAADFEMANGKVCHLHLPDGAVLPALIESVIVKPQYRNPYGPEDQRLPFHVSLTSQQSTDFVDGICNVEFPDGRRIDGVGISRVAPLGRDPSAAYLQIIFS